MSRSGTYEVLDLAQGVAGRESLGRPHKAMAVAGARRARPGARPGASRTALSSQAGLLSRAYALQRKRSNG